MPTTTYHTTFQLTTYINAPVAKCFDLARSIDVHQQSMAHTREKAIAGRTSGLCQLNDEVSWEATHFGIKQRLRVRITEFDAPHFFSDTMLSGAFESMYHQHYFEEQNGTTIMRDIMMYRVPYSVFGRVFNYLFLERYMVRLLQTRNAVIKKLARENM